jgi:integrase
MVKPTKQQTHRQHGTGSLRELGEKRFRLGYDVNAPGEKRRQRTEVFYGTKSAAKLRLASLVEAARRGGVAGDDAITFEELASRFLEAKGVSREATTCALYERTIKAHLTPHIGKLKARNLTPNHIARLIGAAVDESQRKSKGRPLAASYRRSLRTLIGSICEYGVRTDVLIRNPAKLVEIPSAPHRESMQYDRDDLAKLIEASVTSPMHALIVCAVGSGLRRGELCGWKWSDVDLVTGEFRLERNAKNVGRAVVIGKLKTANSARSDVLPPFCVKVLKAHRVAQVERHLALGIRDPEGFIFDSASGGVSDPNEVSRAFHRFVVRAGIKPLRFHDMRHIFASSAFASGVSLKVVSQALGHASVAITSATYIAVVDASKHEKASILENYLGDTVRRGLRSGTADA